jgi:hypothetical protein
MHLDTSFEYTVGDGGKDSGRGLLLTHVGDEDCKIARPIIDVRISWKHVRYLSAFDVFFRKDAFYYWEIPSKLIPSKMKKAFPAKKDSRWYWRAPRHHLCNVLNTSDWNGTDKQATVESEIILDEDDRLHLRYWCLLDMAVLSRRFSTFQAVDNHKLAQLELKIDQAKTPSPYEDTPDPWSARGKRLAQVEIKFGDLRYTLIAGSRDAACHFKFKHDCSDRPLVRYVVDLRQDKEGSTIVWHIPPSNYQATIHSSLAVPRATKVDMAFMRAASKFTIRDKPPAKVCRGHFAYWSPQAGESDSDDGPSLADMKAKQKEMKAAKKSSSDIVKAIKERAKKKDKSTDKIKPMNDLVVIDMVDDDMVDDDMVDDDGHVTSISPGPTPIKKRPRLAEKDSHPSSSPASPEPKRRKASSSSRDVVSSVEFYRKEAVQAKAQAMKFKGVSDKLVEICRVLVEENKRLNALTETMQAGGSQLTEDSARVRYWQDVAKRESMAAEAARQRESKSAEAARQREIKAAEAARQRESKAAEAARQRYNTSVQRLEVSVQRLEAQLLDTVNKHNAERTEWSQNLQRSFSSATHSWERAQQATSMLLGSQVMGGLSGAMGMAQSCFPPLSTSSPLRMPPQSWMQGRDMAVSYHPVQVPASLPTVVAEPRRRFSEGQQRTSRVLEVQDSGFGAGVRTGGYAQDERRMSTGFSPMGGHQERRVNTRYSHGPDSRDRQIGDGLQPMDNAPTDISRRGAPTSLPGADGTGQDLEVPSVAAAPFLPAPATIVSAAPDPAPIVSAAPGTVASAQLDEAVQELANIVK